MAVFLEQTSLVMHNLNFIQKLVKAHAEYQPEHECCGLIGLNNLKELQVIPCKNTHHEKDKTFEISPKEYIEKSKNLEIYSIYHSHTISSSNPSEYDKISSENWCLPFYIYAIKDQSFYLHFPKTYKIPRLENRTYIPDVQNCFRFIVDYYILNKLIDNMELNFALIKNGQSYSKETIEVIKTFLKINNFKKINDKEDLKKHDLILFEVDNFFSHFGVLSENDQIWHHEGGFLSRKSHVTGELIDRIHSIYRLDLSVY